MRNSVTASVCVVLMAAGLAACGPSQTETTCPGVTIDDGADEACMLRTNEVPNGIPFQGLVYITETGARPLPWIAEELWLTFDATRICSDYGYSTARLRGPLLVCATHSSWSDGLEITILAAVQGETGQGVSDSETLADWRDSCASWCNSACVDEVGGSAEECLAACSLGIAYVGSELGEACAQVQADLNRCEAADACAAPLFVCADDIQAADDACWQCSESADCPDTMTCVTGVCEIPNLCGAQECSRGQICEGEVCVEDTACAGVLCEIGLSCVAGECLPERDTCNEDRTFAADWTPDRIDDDIVASFPDTYPAAPGFFAGDDTVGFSKTRTDNLVVWNIEYGPGAGFERATYTELPEAVDVGYERRIDIVSVDDCAAGAVYAREGAGAVRDTEALVVFSVSSTGEFRDTSFVNYQISEESEVVDIASTFRP